MKKMQYVEPQIDIVLFAKGDVLTTSGNHLILDGSGQDSNGNEFP